MHAEEARHRRPSTPRADEPERPRRGRRSRARRTEDRPPRSRDKGEEADDDARVIGTEEVPLERVHQDALRVLSRLVRHDYEAYLVGGCVRDLLLGRTPKDFDVATSANPRQIKRLFRNGRIIGRRFKLVHVVYGDHIIETSTFRAKPPQDDGQEGEDLLIREDNVFGTAREDATRRDFTINGLFMDPLEERILDYVGGLDDLERRVLRTIGEPRVRMFEDPVRILRAVKFATRLGFRIGDKTWEAMCEAAPELARSAPPRVLEEILRLLRSGTALGAMRMLRACGALGVLLPSLEEFLSGGGEGEQNERTDMYWRLLEALDAEVHAGHTPSAALCVAVLFLHVVESQTDPTTRSLPGAPGDVASVAGEVLEPIARSTRLSRREHARARRIIANQARFTAPKGRQSRPLLFLRSEDFEESLRLFKLRSAAWGQGWDVYEGWRDRFEEALNVPPEELVRLRKRRRRRRRRRRPGSQGAEEARPDDSW